MSLEVESYVDTNELYQILINNKSQAMNSTEMWTPPPTVTTSGTAPWY